MSSKLFTQLAVVKQLTRHRQKEHLGSRRGDVSAVYTPCSSQRKVKLPVAPTVQKFKPTLWGAASAATRAAACSAAPAAALLLLLLSAARAASARAAAAGWSCSSRFAAVTSARSAVAAGACRTGGLQETGAVGASAAAWSAVGSSSAVSAAGAGEASEGPVGSTAECAHNYDVNRFKYTGGSMLTRYVHVVGAW